MEYLIWCTPDRVELESMPVLVFNFKFDGNGANKVNCTGNISLYNSTVLHSSGSYYWLDSSNKNGSREEVFFFFGVYSFL